MVNVVAKRGHVASSGGTRMGKWIDGRDGLIQLPEAGETRFFIFFIFYRPVRSRGVKEKDAGF